MSHAVTGRGGTDTGLWVCDGLIQMHIAIKQQCVEGKQGVAKQNEQWMLNPS